MATKAKTLRAVSSFVISAMTVFTMSGAAYLAPSVSKAATLVTVSGKVTDQNGAPLANILLTVCGLAEGAATDASGNYSFQIAKGAGYCVRVSKKSPILLDASISGSSAHATNGVEFSKPHFRLSYENQIAGRGPSSTDSLAVRTEDLSTDSGLDFVVVVQIVDGDAIRVTGTDDVYIVKIIRESVGAKKFKRLILNPDIFNSYGQLSWSKIKNVSQATMDEYKTSNLAIHVGYSGNFFNRVSVVDPNVYSITSSSNSDVGTKRWLNITPDQFKGVGLDWDSIFTINDTEAGPTFYANGTPLTASDDLVLWASNPHAGASALPTTAPVVTTLDATEFGNNVEDLNGSVEPNGLLISFWFRYSATNPGTCNDTFGTRVPRADASADEKALHTINTATFGTHLGAGIEFSSGVTYYFCVLASNNAGIGLGNILSFTRTITTSAVTSAASHVTSSSATLNGLVTTNASGTGALFFYSAINHPETCNETFGTRVPTSGGIPVVTGTTPISISYDISGLSANTTYYFCAFAQNDVNTKFGDVLSFTTQR